MVATSYAGVVNTDLTWRHSDNHITNTDTYAHVTEPNQRKREVGPKTKQASTVAISTTQSQMSLDSNNPSSRSSTGVPVTNLSKTRKEKSSSKDRSPGRTKRNEQNAI